MWTLFFMFLAGVSNAVMDTIQFKFNISVFSKYKFLNQWADPRLSWRNKWKNGDPKQGERFLLSSTALVFVTDAWHFFQFIMLSCFALSISLNLLAIQHEMFYIENNLLFVFIAFLFFKMSFSLGFTIFWKILNKK